MTQQKKKNQLHKYIYFSSMAIQMAIVIGLTTFFGQWLDSRIINNYSLFTILFSLLGVVGSIYLMVKKVMDINK